MTSAEAFLNAAILQEYMEGMSSVLHGFGQAARGTQGVKCVDDSASSIFRLGRATGLLKLPLLLWQDPLDLRARKPSIKTFEEETRAPCAPEPSFAGLLDGFCEPSQGALMHRQNIIAPRHFRLAGPIASVMRALRRQEPLFYRDALFVQEAGKRDEQTRIGLSRPVHSANSLTRKACKCQGAAPQTPCPNLQILATAAQHDL